MQTLAIAGDLIAVQQLVPGSRIACLLLEVTCLTCAEDQLLEFLFSPYVWLGLVRIRPYPQQHYRMSGQASRPRPFPLNQQPPIPEYRRRLSSAGGLLQARSKLDTNAVSPICLLCSRAESVKAPAGVPSRAPSLFGEMAKGFPHGGTPHVS